MLNKIYAPWMNISRNEERFDKMARVISAVFHPLLIPAYAMAIIFSAPTIYTYIPFEVKRILFLIVAVNNILLPLSLMPFFIHSKLIGSWPAGDSNERVIPLVLSTILYIITAYIVFRFSVPRFLKSYFLAASFLSLAVTLINFWWKISIHSVGAGSLVAVVLMLSFKMYTPLLWYLIAAIVAGGLILSSRLQLRLHNPQQVWFGFFTGFLGLYFVMMLYK